MPSRRQSGALVIPPRISRSGLGFPAISVPPPHARGAAPGVDTFDRPDPPRSAAVRAGKTRGAARLAWLAVRVTGARQDGRSRAVVPARIRNRGASARPAARAARGD